MRIFDRIDPQQLDRREFQLWLLAFTIILVLTVGMGLLMYPSVFSAPVTLTGSTQRKVFFGFCGLGILMLGYLVDRHVMINQLRRKLTEEENRLARLRHEASADLLSSLPGFSHFQDRLTMEYRRAATTQQALSLVVVVLASSHALSDRMEASTAFGDAAKALMRKLRGEDSIYLFSPSVFCIVLPGVIAKNAYLIAARLTDGLQDASGASVRFSFQIQVFNYPEHAKSARELEEAVRPFAPKDLPGVSVEETGVAPNLPAP